MPHHQHSCTHNPNCLFLVDKSTRWLPSAFSSRRKGDLGRAPVDFFPQGSGTEMRPVAPSASAFPAVPCPKEPRSWTRLWPERARAEGPERAPGWALSKRPSGGCKRLLPPRGASTRPGRARLPVACHRPAGHTPGAGWRPRQGSRGACSGAELRAKLLPQPLSPAPSPPPSLFSDPPWVHAKALSSLRIPLAGLEIILALGAMLQAGAHPGRVSMLQTPV